MSLRDDLIAARALIDTPEKWIKGEFEREGCFCAIGAISHVNDGTHSDPSYYALLAALPPGSLGVALFNDAPDTTHADVLALFDRAISKAGA